VRRGERVLNEERLERRFNCRRNGFQRGMGHGRIGKWWEKKTFNILECLEGGERIR
jgi:hypothetical protein